jgi:hypothetical protein
MKKLILLPVILLFFACSDESVVPNDLCTTKITETETCTRCFETENQKQIWLINCVQGQGFTCYQLLHCE